MKNLKPIVGITMGDYNGIAPEVILKALAQLPLDSYRCLLIGAASVFQTVNEQLDHPVEFDTITTLSQLDALQSPIVIYDIFPEFQEQPHWGHIEKAAGTAAGVSIQKAVELALRDVTEAVVTGPVSKEALSLAGYHYPGQTEFLAELTGTDHVVMMLVTRDFRVALATTHCAIHEVSAKITREQLQRSLRIVHNSLIQQFGISAPRIVVTSLNPHGGENGLFGREEIEIIAPAIIDLQKSGMTVEGPFPADTLFARSDRYDAYFAMYHDQGLIPFKMKAFGKGVNFTAGLPAIRTSPDHGTAFNIAGKNTADEHSMMEAITLAVELIQNRKKRPAL
ncbi:4-hydroxythreonine-4-phosphate dehydrogenase PdxA [candidate division KSB1 bacterium]|nr:4-hydroxythreonine-4-phosphate dehydrogenase PdxA [candidate division KSB1 bacterium]